MSANINEAYEASKKAAVEMYENIKKAAGKGDEEAKKTLKYSVVIHDFPIIIESDMRDFIVTRSKLHEYMLSNELYLIAAFKDIEFENLFDDGIFHYNIALENFCKATDNIMKYYGFEDFSGEDMLESIERKLPGMKKWDEAYRMLIKAKEKYERMKQIQASRPYSYGGFSGRGFSGALTAGLLNIAADVIGGAAEQAADNSRMNSIHNDMITIYDNILNKRGYLSWYTSDCEKIINMLLIGFIGEKQFPKRLTPDDYMKTIPADIIDSLLQASKIDTTHYNGSLKAMIALIAMRPYSYMMYVALCRLDPKFKDELTDFLTVNKMIEPFMYEYDPDYIYNHSFYDIIKEPFSLD